MGQFSYSASSYFETITYLLTQAFNLMGSNWIDPEFMSTYVFTSLLTNQKTISDRRLETGYGRPYDLGESLTFWQDSNITQGLDINLTSQMQQTND
mgnify:CR=1 FL=1